MRDLVSRFGRGVADAAGLTGRAVLGVGTLGMSEALRMAAEAKKEEQQRDLARIGGVLAGEEIPAFLRPGGAEGMTPEQFEMAKTRQLFNLGTPEAARIGMQFVETPETRLNESNVQSQIAERKEMNDIRQKQVALQKEELDLTRQDKLRNYDLAVKELEAKLRNPINQKELFDRETKLRNEFVTQSKDFITQRDAYDKIAIAAQDPSAAGDISLIYGFMKLNDPTSTVREGEYATAQNAGSIPQRIWSQYNKALSGQRLDPGVRNDFVDRSRRLFEGSKRQHDKRVVQYTGLTQRAGGNPEQVIVDLGLVDQPAPQQPSYQDGAIATNSKTGQKLVYKGGKWRPL